MKFLKKFLRVTGVLSAAGLLSASLASGSRGPIDEILPPDGRLCGGVSVDLVEGTPFYELEVHPGMRILVDGGPVIRAGFEQVINMRPRSVDICVPYRGGDVLPSYLWVPWFLYINPAASGVSVVSQ